MYNKLIDTYVFAEHISCAHYIYLSFPFNIQILTLRPYLLKLQNIKIIYRFLTIFKTCIVQVKVPQSTNKHYPHILTYPYNMQEHLKIPLDFTRKTFTFNLSFTLDSLRLFSLKQKVFNQSQGIHNPHQSSRVSFRNGSYSKPKQSKKLLNSNSM